MTSYMSGRATVTSEEEAEALRVAVEAIPGPKGFKDHLGRRHGDFDVY